MNIKQLLLSCVCLFAIPATNSAEYNITDRQRAAHKVINSAPQLFLFNPKGELIHHSRGFHSGLKKAFKNTEQVENAEQLKNNLLNLTQAPRNFDDYEFTLFYLGIDEGVGPCPPCRKQERLLEKIKDKMADKKINYHVVNIIQETYYLDE
ncbi:hypothetical protein SG34_024135 [Thalassomonas viridans]|uniref:CMP/dCMP-type deaminase domain-containing protein n=1 Tax=Thalassomonas viridans TaxID=137584 RepID=A0AAE9Z3A5_9GAMM|nr:hypothetical protein [Thalassomonas viridans]WDE04397.1 hypothetical protein SG34_024135 [Thalassomonas viridans]